MITDPENPQENPQEWDEPILASSLEEAKQICRRKAEKFEVQLDRVETPKQVRKGQNQLYRCWFRG